MNTPTDVSAPRYRVRVWFGQTAISDVVKPAEAAERHAAAMQRRFACLRVTNEPLTVREVEPS
jgi:hypothetical protein